MNFNIFGKQVSDEERKKPLEHGGDHFKFVSCVDLSKGVKVIPYFFSSNTKYTVEEYSKDLGGFIIWWANNIYADLNGFSGFGNIKFEFVGFELINEPIDRFSKFAGTSLFPDTDEPKPHLEPKSMSDKIFPSEDDIYLK